MNVNFQLIKLINLKDNRYKAIKSLILSKGITKLSEAFTIIPMSTVKDDMNVNYSTLRRRVNLGLTLTVKDISSIAKLFEVLPEDILRLILADLSDKSSNRISKKK